MLATLTTPFIQRSVPQHLRSDAGPELCAKVVRGWRPWLGIQTLVLQPGSPWETGDTESCAGKLRDEFLGREPFFTLQGAEILVERWRQHYNTVCPHSALDYRPPAPEARFWPPLAMSHRSEIESLVAVH